MDDYTECLTCHSKVGFFKLTLNVFLFGEGKFRNILRDLLVSCMDFQSSFVTRMVYAAF